MEINLFTYSGEHNRVDKTGFISNRFPLVGTLKQSTSITDPVIVIEKTNPITYDYNYMYINEFKRWYFITDFRSINNNLWEITAHVDVLYTFKNDIANNLAIVDKIENEFKANLYLDDGSFVMDSRKYNEVKEFPNGFNDTGSYILICAGGV